MLIAWRRRDGDNQDEQSGVDSGVARRPDAVTAEKHARNHGQGGKRYHDMQTAEEN